MFSVWIVHTFSAKERTSSKDSNDEMNRHTKNTNSLFFHFTGCSSAKLRKL